MSRAPAGMSSGHVHEQGLTVGAAAGNTPAERRAAARTVASWSRDADDLRQLLDTLGLRADEGRGAERGRALNPQAGERLHHGRVTHRQRIPKP